MAPSLRSASFTLALFAAAQVHAASAPELVAMVNAFRASPGTCEGRAVPPAPPLTPSDALARARIGSGMFLDQALERAGYPAERADVIHVSGPLDAAGAMAAIRQRHCRTLLSTDYTAIGAAHTGSEWQIVLAQPARPTILTTLPDWHATGQAILQLVNAARAVPRMCGDQAFGPTEPVTWNDRLGEAALEHSLDMATHRYFNHKGTDGSVAANRAERAGYAWRRVGENIASGQGTPEEAVDGWIASPGHCANLMNPGFTQMGAAYAAAPGRPVLYWTQVFATPR